MNKTRSLSDAALHSIKCLFTDVDDTLTTNGLLVPEALNAMYDLQANGIVVVPVTGASAGWCDMMLRMWPVEHVIGENGAFAMTLSDSNTVELDCWTTQEEMSQSQQAVIAELDVYLASHPQFFFSRDQSYRLFDAAIDVAQSNEGIAQAQIDSLINYLRSKGIQACQSSIHVNAWQGTFNKFGMVKRLLDRQFGVTESQLQETVAYIGDAPNDEPMFQSLRHTFGVSNIATHLPHMSHHPVTVLSKPGGLGFAECASLIIESAKESDTNVTNPSH